MSNPQDSRPLTYPTALYRSSSIDKDIELGYTTSTASTSFDPLPKSDITERRSSPLLDSKYHSNANHLHSKTFATANRSPQRRLFDQAWVGILLFLWCACIWSFTVHWNFRGDFTPTVVYGNFTLGQAKAVDVAWNMVVGRAAQAFIAFVFYNVMKDVLMRITETTNIPLDLFIALVFRPFDFGSKIKMVNALPHTKGWRVTTTLIWLFISVIYIASIPAINDAMTGYVLQHHLYFVSPIGEHFLPNCTLRLELDYETIMQLNQTLKQFEIFTETCLPRDGYQWGFAQFWVVLSVSLSTAWIIGTYAIWIDAQHNSELVRKGRKMGMNRAIIDTAEAITEALGPDTNAYSETELEKALKYRPGVMYSTEDGAKNDTEHIRLSSKKDEKLQLSWVTKYGA